MTTIRSASRIVESRCAMIRLVRFSIRRNMASWICFSVLVSTLEVASSRIRILGNERNARPIVISCRCPWERLAPESVSTVSYPSLRALTTLSQFESALASIIFSSEMEGSAYFKLARTVSVKRTVSCRTIPILSRRASVETSRMSVPSIRMEPLSTS